eukprot:CAMPEP_0179427112 /NCGR_PEP_ID=MMETSP0799-20121207/13179_1 /TAXON_ID=46947 /ORGANISM="Geminigera cryophila, Strain CCMP2564" /LENGTH=41 /DNA_ID= /DNA_START= /DNA_END= /DNA_ORIENTATION=
MPSKKPSAGGWPRAHAQETCNALTPLGRLDALYLTNLESLH